eukprot:586075-Heterocapsa_arctica.AAC.1
MNSRPNKHPRMLFSCDYRSGLHVVRCIHVRASIPPAYSKTRTSKETRLNPSKLVGVSVPELPPKARQPSISYRRLLLSFSFSL